MEMDIVVRFAFDQLDALCIERGAQILECFMEESR